MNYLTRARVDSAIMTIATWAMFMFCYLQILMLHSTRVSILGAFGVVMAVMVAFRSLPYLYRYPPLGTLEAFASLSENFIVNSNPFGGPLKRLAPRRMVAWGFGFILAWAFLAWMLCQPVYVFLTGGEPVQDIARQLELSLLFGSVAFFQSRARDHFSFWRTHEVQRRGQELAVRVLSALFGVVMVAILGQVILAQSGIIEPVPDSFKQYLLWIGLVSGLMTGVSCLIAIVLRMARGAYNESCD